MKKKNQHVICTLSACTCPEVKLNKYLEMQLQKGAQGNQSKTDQNKIEKTSLELQTISGW